jgi:hypothetical protein
MERSAVAVLSPLQRIERSLTPWVTFVVIPRTWHTPTYEVATTIDKNVDYGHVQHHLGLESLALTSAVLLQASISSFDPPEKIPFPATLHRQVPAFYLFYPYATARPR